MDEITRNKLSSDCHQMKQFQNLLRFLIIFVDDRRILKLSPDYLIEKFSKYIGAPSEINDWYNQGLNIALEQMVYEEYLKIWKPSFKNDPTIDTIKTS